MNTTEASATRLTSDTHESASAFDAIETYFERGWTDGLPVVPPTPELVSAFLAAAKLQPDQIVGVEPVKGAVITAEKAAINAVMAGCKPEYMPVVVAAVEAIAEDQFSLHGHLSKHDGRWHPAGAERPGCRTARRQHR